MNKYDFRLTPAYCLFNGAGVKNQNGNEITFLLENTNNEELKTKLKKAFVSHLDYLRTKENCLEIYKKSEIINFQNKVGKTEYQQLEGEKLVSDFENTASNVDIVLHSLEGVFLFDIKTGGFDRKYCTMQLNAYRLMYENSYDEKVLGLYVLNTKSKKTFTIFACDDKDILKLLDSNLK